jgi:hypothetical protein
MASTLAGEKTIPFHSLFVPQLACSSSHMIKLSSYNVAPIANSVVLGQALASL